MDASYKYNKKIQFPGGQIEFKDIKIGKEKNISEKDSIKNTAYREMEEESNGALNKYIHIENLDFQKTHYIERSKYLFFLVEVNEKIDLIRFGDHEIVNADLKWRREFFWINFEKARNLMENQETLYFNGIFDFLKDPDLNFLFKDLIFLFNDKEEKKEYKKFGFRNLKKKGGNVN